MSLKSFLKIEEVNRWYEEEFPCPDFVLKKEIPAPETTNHLSLVGTAFDYLTGFYIKYLNPDSITQKWIAEASLDFFRGNATECVGEKACVKRLPILK